MQPNNIAKNMSSIQEKSKSNTENDIENVENKKKAIICEKGPILEKIIISKLSEEIRYMPYAKYLELRYEAIAKRTDFHINDTIYCFQKICENINKGIATTDEKQIYKSVKSLAKKLT